MDQLMNGWMDGSIDGWMDGRIDGWANRWVLHEQMDG